MQSMEGLLSPPESSSALPFSCSSCSNFLTFVFLPNCHPGDSGCSAEMQRWVSLKKWHFSGTCTAVIHGPQICGWTSDAIGSLSPLTGCREDNKHTTNIAHTPAISVLSTWHQLKIRGQHFNNVVNIRSVASRHICSRMLRSEEHILERPKLSSNYNKGLKVKMLACYYSLLSSCKMGVIFFMGVVFFRLLRSFTDFCKSLTFSGRS